MNRDVVLFDACGHLIVRTYGFPRDAGSESFFFTALMISTITVRIYGNPEKNCVGILTPNACILN
jgi:hypothetical protein